MTVEDPTASRDREPGSPERSGSGRLSLRTRLTLALIVATLLPLLGLGLLLFATGAGGSGAPGSPIDRVVLAAIAAAGFAGIVLALLFASTLLQPLRAVVTAVERVSDGDRRTRIEVPGDDELALLADRYNRLVEDLDRRDRSLGRVRSQIAALDPSAGRDRLLGQAADGVRAAFEMTSAEIVLGDPDDLSARFCGSATTRSASSSGRLPRRAAGRPPTRCCSTCSRRRSRSRSGTPS
jgi:HAMP domain-containing protein